MDTCSFTIHFKIMNTCSEVFLDCIIPSSKLEEAPSSPSSFQSAPLIQRPSQKHQAYVFSGNIGLEF